MTTQSAFIGFVMAVLAGVVPAQRSAAQSPDPAPGLELARFTAAGPATEGWLMVVNQADASVSFTRRNTYQGSVALVTSIVIGMVEPGTVEAATSSDSVARLVMAGQVAADRAEGRATGDYQVRDAQLSDTLRGQVKVYVLRYRRAMTSWKRSGWVEAMTVYYYFAPDFPEQHRMVRLLLSEQFQVRSTGNQAVDESATAWSVIERLQGEGTGLSLR